MSRSRPVRYSVVEIEGVRYAVLRERLLRGLCERAGAALVSGDSPAPATPADPLPADRIGRRLRDRRSEAGLSQVQLARRAGIRPETLNRIERGHTTPDFATVRKLLRALQTCERRLLPPVRRPRRVAKTAP